MEQVDIFCWPVLLIGFGILCMALIALHYMKSFYVSCPACKKLVKRHSGYKSIKGRRQEKTSITRGSFNPFRPEPYKAWEISTIRTYQDVELRFKCSNCGSEWTTKDSKLANIEKRKERIPNDQFHY